MLSSLLFHYLYLMALKTISQVVGYRYLSCYFLQMQNCQLNLFFLDRYSGAKHNTGWINFKLLISQISIYILHYSKKLLLFYSSQVMLDYFQSQYLLPIQT